MDIIEYTIPEWAVNFLTYGEDEQLNEDELSAVTAFIKRARDEHAEGHWSLPSEFEPGFMWYNDINEGRMGCNCLTVQYVLMPPRRKP